MNVEMKYGGVALGVESALPTPRLALGRGKRLVLWLVATLKRWA